MKKVTLGLALVTLNLLPLAGALAIETIPPPPVTDVEGFINILRFGANLLFTVLMVLAVIFILIAAFHYLLAFGSPERVKAASNMLIYAIVAIAVALLSQGVRLIVQNILMRGAS
ncbi:MAG: hypothetical protein HYS57_01520 [Parcubacteria group bacterium]|nr:hypothetical protein [Parcubacteria group bacterium]